MPEPDPFAKFHEWIAAAEQSEPSDPNAMTVATATADGAPVGAHRAAQGDRRGGRRAARLRLLHQPGEPQGRGTGGQPPRRAAVPLEDARPANPHRGSHRARQRRRGGRLLRDARAQFAARRVGVGPVPPARLPRRSRTPVGRIRGALSRRRKFPARRTGAATACCRPISSSGRTCRSACTTAPPTHAPMGAGRSENSFRERSGGAGGGLCVSPRARRGRPGRDAHLAGVRRRMTRCGSSRRPCGCRFSTSPRSTRAAASRCASSS